MNNLIEKTLTKIKKENIKPTSRRYFSIRNIFFWSTTILMVIFSSLAVSLILFLIIDLDWDIYKHLNDSWLENILIAIPHLWIFLMFIFSILSYIFFKKTKKAYRRNILLIFFIILISVFISGTALYSSGFSEKLNNIFQENIPQYEKFIHSKKDQWSQVNKGLLSGIIKTINNNSLNIIDFSNKNWEIIITPQTIIKGKVLIEINEEIKIIGEKIKNNKFQALEIRPWGKGKR